MQPDLILMDIRLRGETDGIEAAREIWNRLQIPFIYATGHSDQSTLERAKATVPFGYILKPVEERELYVAVETALRRYELDQQLRDQEQWLRIILGGIQDGVIVTDLQGDVRFLNTAAGRLLGLALSEAFYQPIAEMFSILNEQTQQPIENPALLALSTHHLIEIEEPALLLRQDQRIVPIGGSAVSFCNEQGAIAGVVLMLRDVTQQRFAADRNLAIARAQQLEEQMAEMERLDRLKDDFLSTVSHELRTPLTNIRLAIDMLENTFNKPDVLSSSISAQRQESLTRYLKILQNQCDQEISLVSDLLDLQKLNADCYPFNPVLLDLSRWLETILEGFQDRLCNRELRVQVDLPPDLPPFCSDESSLTRILVELLYNACKYTPPGEQITIAVQLNDQGDRCNLAALQLIVTNSGVEIPAAEMPRIFEPFYRIPKTDRWQQGGTGLGLALIKKLVTVMNGTIAAQSIVGQTSFTVELPSMPNHDQLA